MAGHVPIKDDITLTRGADFIALYRTAPGDPAIGPGTTARIELADTSDTDAPLIATWTAHEITADTIAFKVEHEASDLIESLAKYRLMVRFGDAPHDDYCWYFGSIKRVQ